MATVVPGEIFTDEVITATKLNNAATPTITVDNGEVTWNKISEKLIEPAAQDITDVRFTGTALWEMLPGRYNQFAIIRLEANTTLNITGLVEGMYGTLRIVKFVLPGYTLTLPAGSIVANNGAGAIDLTTSYRSMLRFIYYNSLIHFWITHDYITL